MNKKYEHKENTKYGYNERMVCGLYFSSERFFFSRFSLFCRAVCIDIVDKKIETIIAAVANWMRLWCLFVVPISFVWSNLKTVEIFGQEIAIKRPCDVVRSCTQYLVVTCKCINELGAECTEWSAREKCCFDNFIEHSQCGRWAHRWKMDLRKLFIVSVINQWHFCFRSFRLHSGANICL